MMRIKLVGIVLIVVAILGFIYFTLAIPVDLYMYELSPYFPADPGFLMPFLQWDVFDWRWGIAIPVYTIIVVCCVVLIWVGGKMVTTPPSQPKERVESAEGREP